jgi:murein DD-endopeptidase MepM/ murein hydrolase activator NlpD
VNHRHPSGTYQGRRRVPTPPRSRYAAVMTTAVVGAGVVAIGTGAAMPDRATDNGLSMEASADFGDLSARQLSTTDRANRSAPRASAPMPRLDQPAPNVWVLPLQTYTVTSFFGQRWGVLHPGVDLGAPEGTPFYAAAAGKVVLARWNGGYGYNVVIDHGGGIVSVYGHASKLLVNEGQFVQAGDKIALVGNTGHSFGSHLHFEVRLNDVPIEPLAFMLEHGVDIQKHTEAAYS